MAEPKSSRGVGFAALVVLLAGLTLVDVLIADPLPIVDEAILALLTLLVGWRGSRGKKRGDSRRER